MNGRFLWFCYGFLIVILFALYVAGVAIVYWTPTRRTPGLPFSIGLFEWLAVWGYLTAIFLIAGGFYFFPRARLTQMWFGTAICAVVYAVSGWTIERTLYFDAAEAEKDQGGLIVVGCIFGFICCGIFWSLLWIVCRRGRKWTPEPTNSIGHANLLEDEVQSKHLG